MESSRKSFFRQPNRSSTTGIGTSKNCGKSLEIQASFSNAGKSQCSDVVSEVVEGQNLMAQLWRTPSLKEFSFKYLKIATNNFSHDRLLGKGHVGKLYKGWVEQETLAPFERGTGMAVTIKIFNPSTEMQGFDEWQEMSKHYQEIYDLKLQLEQLEDWLFYIL